MQGSDFNRAFDGIVSFFIACLVAALILGGALTAGGIWVYHRLHIHIHWGQSKEAPHV